MKGAKKLPALCAMRSWLTAVGVTAVGPHGERIEVGSTAVLIAVPEDELLEGINLPLSDAASTDVKRAMESFHVVTEALGRGRPVPVDRGVEVTRAALYGQDPFLVHIRHREFRMSPDLPPSRARALEPVLARWAHSFYGLNRSLCELLCVDVDDLLTHARCWSVVFAHKARPMGDDEFARILYAFLRQRGAELRRDLWRKVRSTTPDQSEAWFALTGEVWQGPQTIMDVRAADEETPTMGTAVHRSRLRTRESLRARLGRLPHDEMVRALDEAARSDLWDFLTQRVAQSLLREHRRTCSVCEGVEDGRHEYVPPADALGSAELVEYPTE